MNRSLILRGYHGPVVISAVSNYRRNTRRNWINFLNFKFYPKTIATPVYTRVYAGSVEKCYCIPMQC